MDIPHTDTPKRIEEGRLKLKNQKEIMRETEKKNRTEKVNEETKRKKRKRERKVR